MREIKFRAWDNIAGMRYSSDFPNLVQFWNYVLNRDLVQGFELMQYTGLKDKNGKEIYEGDFIKDIDSWGIGQVVWSEDDLCWTTKFSNNELWGFVPQHGRDNHCEVIGDIYSNPELREEK